jgi:hypothetical protein
MTTPDLIVAGIVSATTAVYLYVARRTYKHRQITTAAGQKVLIDPELLERVIVQAAQEQWEKERERPELKFDHRQRVSATAHRAQRLLALTRMPEPADLKFRVAAALRATQGAASA